MLLVKNLYIRFKVGQASEAYQFAALVLLTMFLLSFQNCAKAKFTSLDDVSAKSNLAVDLDPPVNGGDVPNPTDGDAGGNGGDGNGGGNDDDQDNGNDDDNDDDGNDDDDQGSNPDDDQEDPNESICSADAIVNGSFELTDSRKGLVHNIQLDNLANSSQRWDVFHKLPGVKPNSFSWYTVKGSGIEVQASLLGPAYDGVNYVELDSHPTSLDQSRTNSTMSQQIYLQKSGKYRLVFYYKARTKNVAENDIEVLINDKLVKVVKSQNEPNWRKVIVNLNNVSSGHHKVSFRAAGKETTYGGLIDKVSLHKVCAKK